MSTGSQHSTVTDSDGNGTESGSRNDSAGVQQPVKDLTESNLEQHNQSEERLPSMRKTANHLQRLPNASVMGDPALPALPANAKTAEEEGMKLGTPPRSGFSVPKEEIFESAKKNAEVSVTSANPGYSFSKPDKSPQV